MIITTSASVITQRTARKLWLADRKIRTIAGHLVRELERNLGQNHPYADLLELFKKVLLQKRQSPKKRYSLHEPEVQCISKEKEHKKYKFGNKVSTIRSWNSAILGALSLRNEYDGHTIEQALEQSFRLTGKRLKILAGDRGYQEKKKYENTRILIPDILSAKDSRYEQLIKKLFRKRAGIESTIS